jgi:hypothetical protein
MTSRSRRRSFVSPWRSCLKYVPVGHLLATAFTAHTFFVAKTRFLMQRFALGSPQWRASVQVAPILSSAAYGWTAGSR